MKQLQLIDSISYPPRALSRTEAARWVGESLNSFERAVQSGRYPKPIRVGGRLLWDRYALDLAFSATIETSRNTIDEALRSQ